MNKLTTFIKGIIENGYARIVEFTDEPNVYNVIDCQYNNLGFLEKYFKKIKYDKEYIINGEKNPHAHIEDIDGLDVPNDSFIFGSIICKLIKEDLKSDKSTESDRFVILSSSTPETRIMVPQKEIDRILNISKHILGISNHKLICLVSTSLDYLETYLLEQAKTLNTLNSSKENDISDIEEAEKKFIERIEYVCGLAEKLKDANLSREEYNELYSKWIDLYDDNDFYDYQTCRQEQEKQLNLLTTKQ